MTAGLEAYKAKRDFTRTAEPSGDAPIAPTNRARFVVQKHAASRLHYDLRLEHDGVFKSWAVTKGPSLDPHERRLAVEVEDHPLDYGDFEGLIPKGEYGGGTVMLWDRGYWELEKGASVDAALRKGHLSFRFDGERLRGGWSLVRIRNDRDGKRGRNNWLLIKHEDPTAREHDDDALLSTNDSSVASGRSMSEIAEGLGKAPKPFITRQHQSAKAVWSTKASRQPPEIAPAATASLAPARAPASTPVSTPASGQRVKAMPAFVEPALARLVDRPPGGDAWVHEIKFDGYRMQARVAGGKAALRTRKGLDWTSRFPEIAADLDHLPDGILDGEIVALDSEGRPDFAQLQGALSTHSTADLAFFIFDAMFASSGNQLFDLQKLPLSDRKSHARLMLKHAQSARLRFVEHFTTSGQAVLDSACKMHLEGVVSKRFDAPYRSGRGDDWLKSKCRGGQEVVIGGWTTTGAAFRSLLAGVWRNGELIYVGRVGTGFGRTKLDRLLPRLKEVEASTSPFNGAGAPRNAAGVHWVRPQLVAEIGFAGWTGDGHLRQASFKGLREDKPAADVHLEEPVKAEAKAQRKSQPKAAAGRATAEVKTSNVICGVTISNPDKALWPAADGAAPVTKLEMARYIERVSQWMLPYIEGRPCSIIRTPGGIDGERFFQRHAGVGTSSLITLTTVWGDRKPYLQFDTVEALIAAAQSGVTEIHPWNCLPGLPEVPGRFVFDLDPDEGLGFDRVVEAALEVRQRLREVGLESLCKTTGGKGLHIVTWIKQSRSQPIGWREAKAFAQAICLQMTADAPGAYTTTMAKKARVGRIFLDYLRNDRMASAVALLSPRARPGAPVSMPISWDDVKPGLDPRAFTIHTASQILQSGDPWADWADIARPFSASIRKLAANAKRATRRRASRID